MTSGDLNAGIEQTVLNFKPVHCTLCSTVQSAMYNVQCTVLCVDYEKIQWDNKLLVCSEILLTGDPSSKSVGAPSGCELLPPPPGGKQTVDPLDQ
jgi:hypothetical protein